MYDDIGQVTGKITEELQGPKDCRLRCYTFVMDCLRAKWTVKQQPCLNGITTRGCTDQIMSLVHFWGEYCLLKSPFFSEALLILLCFVVTELWRPASATENLCSGAFWKHLSLVLSSIFIMHRYVLSVCFLARLRLPGLSGKARLSWNKAAWSALLQTAHLLAWSRSPLHVPTDMHTEMPQLHAPPLTQS